MPKTILTSQVACRVLYEKAVKHNKNFSLFNHWFQFLFLRSMLLIFKHHSKLDFFLCLSSTLFFTQRKVALARVVLGEKTTLICSHIKNKLKNKWS